ncbi:hypothetical protein SAMN04488027_11256 [Psychroflexus sediminis]|uniref:Uncharacterized protein n=1 Tax=Psychroflexus sediminis TaxID=470826 RepID=A0A1G7YGK1_9FLAO|nr:hypothetical protein SAMN04488027_11256 [Psychroflexus sediminis]
MVAMETIVAIVTKVAIETWQQQKQQKHNKLISLCTSSKEMVKKSL